MVDQCRLVSHFRQLQYKGALGLKLHIHVLVAQLCLVGENAKAKCNDNTIALLE